MNTKDRELFLIDEEIAYFRESSRYYPERILGDFTLAGIEELWTENSWELQQMSTEMQVGLSYTNLDDYDEAQQILLWASYHPYLMWLFLRKKDFIDKLLKIRESKIKEQEHKDRKKDFFSETEIQELINSKNILDVVSKYAGLPTRYTPTHNMPCPFPEHPDKTWSFHIYDKTNSFYCYGCRRWWGIVQFVKHLKGISDKEAFKELFPQR